MEYTKVISIIENKRRFGNLPGIEISRELLAAVGNPHQGLKFIHIAGTNGKGSTAAFLCQILKEAGIKTGMFTSPHLLSFVERIRVDGTCIPETEAARIGTVLLKLKTDVSPTMFDYCLVMAMLYFKEQGCRLVVLETGLGGRLDSTNVIAAPLAVLITKIGYDHMETLGSTLAQIAMEKAGIIKAGAPVISESQEPEVIKVLCSVCGQKNVPLSVIDSRELMPLENGFSYQGDSFALKMRGDYQWENAAAAILTARELKNRGYDIAEEQIKRGIAESHWDGRMETVSEEPFLMIDGAHNGHGVKALTKSLSRMYPGEKFHFIMGVLADKDYRHMMELILPLAIDVVTVTPESSRALQGEKLSQLIREKGIPAQNSHSLEAALDSFITPQGQKLPADRTIAFGSLYFIGDIRKILNLSI